MNYLINLLKEFTACLVFTFSLYRVHSSMFPIGDNIVFLLLITTFEAFLNPLVACVYYLIHEDGLLTLPLLLPVQLAAGFAAGKALDTYGHAYNDVHSNTATYRLESMATKNAKDFYWFPILEEWVATSIFLYMFLKVFEQKDETTVTHMDRVKRNSVIAAFIAAINFTFPSALLNPNNIISIWMRHMASDDYLGCRACGQLLALVTVVAMNQVKTSLTSFMGKKLGKSQEYKGATLFTPRSRF